MSDMEVADPMSRDAIEEYTRTIEAALRRTASMKELDGLLIVVERVAESTLHILLLLPALSFPGPVY